MIIFHTDLDNTIIYSYKHDIGENKRCVEHYQGRDISFISQNTYQLLEKLKKQVVIVPTTTRTTEQYRRINLGVGEFSYALVCNGGVLLAGGKEDESWYQESLKLTECSREELNKALKLLDKEKRRSFELRFIRELFVFTKCEEPELVVGNLRRTLDADIVDVFNNGIKVYVVPKTLSKGRAVDRFRNYLDADYVIAAGDSEFDISMLRAADLGIAAPELVQKISEKGNLDINSFSDKIKCPSAEKLYAEAVLETVLSISANRHLG